MLLVEEKYVHVTNQFYYQFFGNNMAAGMEYYRLRGVKGLEDSEVTSNFIKKFNSLADAMNSNSAAGAIRKGNDKEEVRLQDSV